MWRTWDANSSFCMGGRADLNVPNGTTKERRGREGNDAHNTLVFADFGVHWRSTPPPPSWHQSETPQNVQVRAGVCTGVVLAYGGLVWLLEALAWYGGWGDAVRPLVRAAAQGDPCPRVCQNWAQFLGRLGYWAKSFHEWACNLGLGSFNLDFGHLLDC
ncbi:hypothetical protein CXB51_002189 [Gossypium anomalum]|uniref:Uncharacterized protein n=1 Tax=Gossypium anomalum TaxID=47600 RepID=A0A8J5Z8W8_9ROSI|nr:hypothetical protein CXB51_002189 [Gossypium anomalum]